MNVNEVESLGALTNQTIDKSNTLAIICLQIKHMVLALAPVNFAHKTKQTNKIFIELFPQNLSRDYAFINSQITKHALQRILREKTNLKYVLL